jgi:hypothetical protein
MQNINLNKKKPTYYPQVRKFPIYGLVVCGIILILVGVYFQLNYIELSGDNGEPFRINGPASICFGIAILVFPIYILIKQYREKQSFDRDIF